MDLSFKELRTQILQNMLAAVEAGDADSYSVAYDALVKCEQDAGEFDDHVPGICRDCGCTDEDGCPEGCSWANAEHTLCSSCVGEFGGNHEEPQAPEAAPGP